MSTASARHLATAAAPIVQASHGRDLYTLVAAHTFEGQLPVTAMSATRTDHEDHARVAPGLVPISEAIGFLPIDSGERIAVQRLGRYEGAIDPVDVLGETVYRLNGDGSLGGSGTIVAVDATMRLARPSGGTTNFYGAFKVRADGGKPFAVAGQAGSAVVAATGGLLGIVIGRAGDVVYCAPVIDLIEANDLSLATETAIEQHNAVIVAETSPVAKNLPAPSYLSLFGDKAVERAMTALGAFTTEPHRIGTDLNTEFWLRYSEAPRVRIADLAQLLLHEPAFFKKMYPANSLLRAKLNYVAGLEDLIQGCGLDRQKLILLVTSRHGWNDGQLDALDILESEMPLVTRSAAVGIANGRAVSMDTIIQTVCVIAHAAKRNGRDLNSWDAHVEPAWFSAAGGADDLSMQLRRDAKVRRKYQNAYDTVIAKLPTYRSITSANLVFELSQGRLVRFATAWVVQKATEIFRGEGFHWQCVDETSSNAVAAGSEKWVSSLKAPVVRKDVRVDYSSSPVVAMNYDLGNATDVDHSTHEYLRMPVRALGI